MMIVLGSRATFRDNNRTSQLLCESFTLRPSSFINQFSQPASCPVRVTAVTALTGREAASTASSDQGQFRVLHLGQSCRFLDCMRENVTFFYAYVMFS